MARTSTRLRRRCGSRRNPADVSSHSPRARGCGCEREGGRQQIYWRPPPAVLTIQSGANTPRYAPLPAIMKAARQPIKEISPAALGLASWDAVSLPYTFGVRGLSPPAAKGHAEMITGTVEEQAKKLAQLLREKGFARR